MTEYKVGYKRPPRHTRFQAGNRYGCRKRKRADESEIFKRVLNELIEYREGQKKKRASRIEVLIRRLGGQALKGDINAAVMLLKMRSHVAKHGDICPEIVPIRVTQDELDSLRNL